MTANFTILKFKEFNDNKSVDITHISDEISRDESTSQYKIT